jgi:SAM-dependent methyltransferase
MSSTNRGATRNADDYYRTPAWATAAILPHLRPGFSAPIILDPGCGDGAILRVCRERWPEAILRGFDIEDRGCEWGTVRDALATEHWGRPDLIIANPPFSLAMEFLERALREVRPGGEVCFLLRLAWMAGQKRAAFHRAHPSDVHVLPRRPSFTGKGTDSADYAWFVFSAVAQRRWLVLDCGREAA